MNEVTTARLWVCSCGRVSHVDGGIQPQQMIFEVCPARETFASQRHVFTIVPVVVPIP